MIIVSAVGVGGSVDQPPSWHEYPPLPAAMRGMAKDKDRMESEIGVSSLDYVIVRPAFVSDDPATGSLTVIAPGDKAHKR